METYELEIPSAKYDEFAFWSSVESKSICFHLGISYMNVFTKGENIFTFPE